MNEVAVLVAKKDVCMYVCIAVRTNERTSTTFFAFSFASYCCNSSHQCCSSSNNYRIDNDKAKATTYQWRRHRSGHSKLEYHTSERTRQEESSCFAFLKAVILFIIRHIDIRTHIHTNRSVNQCFVCVCVAKTSRALLLSIHQHQKQ